MFNMGMTEIIIIAAIALVVIGPARLPGFARAVGRGLTEFKRATNDFKSTIADEVEKAAGPEAKDLANLVGDVKKKASFSPKNIEEYLETAANVVETGNNDNASEKKNPENSVNVIENENNDSASVKKKPKNSETS